MYIQKDSWCSGVDRRDARCGCDCFIDLKGCDREGRPTLIGKTGNGGTLGN